MSASRNRSSFSPRFARLLFASVACFAIAVPSTLSADALDDPNVGWLVEDRIRLTVPFKVSIGTPFPVQVEILELAEVEDQQICFNFNYLTAAGAFGGQLQSVRATGQVIKPGVYEILVTLNKEPAEGGLALLTAYLSPDGTWKHRTGDRVFPVRTAATSDALYQQHKAREAQVAKMGAGGGPDTVERYQPRETYFEQPRDRKDLRRWEIAPQAVPPLATVLEQPVRERPVYGIYAWADEYEKAAAAIAEIGIRSLRLSGPWGQADVAMRLAAENDVEVLFTLGAASTWPEYKTQRRPYFDSDADFIRAFEENVAAFLERYGAGGTFERDYDLETPLKVVEIWNEPNFSYMSPDTGDRQADMAARQALYPKLLKAGYTQVKAAQPDLLVAGFAGGGAAAADFAFIDAIHQAHPDIGDFYDLLTTHPYTHGAPPEADKLKPWGRYSIASNLSRIRESIGAGGLQPPVWYTEMGWRYSYHHGGTFRDKPNHHDHLVTPDLQAAYIVRTYLYAMRIGVGRVHMMSLHDTDSYNGGLLDRRTHEWRRVAHGIHHLIERLPHPGMLGSLADGEAGAHIYRYDANLAEPGVQPVVAAWHLDGPQLVSIPVSGRRSIDLYDMVGNHRELKVVNGQVQVELGPFPVFLE